MKIFTFIIVVVWIFANIVVCNIGVKSMVAYALMNFILGAVWSANLTYYLIVKG